MSKETQAPEEKEPQGSGTEHPEESPSKGGGVKGAIQSFKDKKEKEAKESSEKKDEKPCETCSVSDEEIEVEEKQEAKLWIVDEKGNKTPAIFKADGKMHTPGDPEWIKTQVSLGVHSNVKTEEAKKVSQEFEEAKPFLDLITRAAKEGRLVVDGQKLTPENVESFDIKREEKEEEEEEDELDDPTVKKLKEEIKGLKKEQKDMKEGQFLQLVEEAKGKLFADIESVQDDCFMAYTRLEEDKDLHNDQPLRVWDVLKDPKKNGKEAMKISHDQMLKFFHSSIEKHPELLDPYRDDIVNDYLERKQKKEEAPISPPSGAETRTPLSKKERPKGLKANIQAWVKKKEEEARAGH